MHSSPTQPWTINDSATLYGVHKWGKDLFDIDTDGNLCISVPSTKSETNAAATVPIVEIIRQIQQKNQHGNPQLPILLRIENHLENRISLLHNTFHTAIANTDYKGTYQGVFPVKVNQQCQVIEEISRYGSAFNYGLEAGSKAELVLALTNITPGNLLILNGYKDQKFIDLGLWAQKIGQRCFFVLESLNEFELLLQRSTVLGIRPRIGVRVKLAVQVAGMWTETSGDRSSFGLDSRQLLTVIQTLRQHHMLDCLQLLHCHMGSQIPCLAEIKDGVRAACQYYISLTNDGAAMKYIDFGGGLAVDYSGTASEYEHSCNYTVADYAKTIVEQIRTTLDPQQIAHPHIITESGRATVANSSVLLFNIIDVMRFIAQDAPQPPASNSPAILHQLFTLYQAVSSNLANSSPLHNYADAKLLRQQLRLSFQHGTLTLQQRATGEDLFLAIAQLLLQQHDTSAAVDQLREDLADIYYGNFSVFQSLPDTWAIGQKFPVMPLHRLHEKPQRDAIISDLTCDCDGKLNSFIVNDNVQTTLPLHPFDKNKKYYLGVFLMGAYQETLGDIHNLFGDTHVVSVRIHPDDTHTISNIINGDSIAEVLTQVQYQPQTLLNKIAIASEEAQQNGTINATEHQQIISDFEATLDDYTYYCN